jgi:hypothetical protein
MDRLQRHLPSRLRRIIARARKPHAIWLRVPFGITLTIAGLFGFLPVLGFWMTPLGLALLAVDLPFLHRPIARLLAYFNGKLASASG